METHGDAWRRMETHGDAWRRMETHGDACTCRFSGGKTGRFWGEKGGSPHSTVSLSDWGGRDGVDGGGTDI